MGLHNTGIPPLFTVNLYAYNEGALYLKGKILEGQLKGKYFIAEYREVSYNTYINSSNDESSIYFRSSSMCDNLYFNINIGIGSNCSSPYDHLTFELTKNMANGEFIYANFMDHVAYIILSGMLVTGI